MACNDCIKLLPIVHADNCRKTRPKIKSIRIACCDALTLVYGTKIVPDNGCGELTFEDYEITDVALTDAAVCPLPFVDVVVENEDDIDELYTLALDDDDFSTRNYVLNPQVKFYDPCQEAVLLSLEEQEIHVFYELEGLASNNTYTTRHFKGKVRGIEGGIRDGYTLSIEIEDPSDAERPKFFLPTIAALDALTQPTI